MLKRVQKLIADFNFLDAFKELYQNNYHFDFNNLSRDFPKIDANKMYLFIMYTISIEESVEKHITICNYLYFMEPYINGSDMLIKWHLEQALKISPYNQDVLNNWIFGIYNGNPDSPFSELELGDYKKRLKPR